MKIRNICLCTVTLMLTAPGITFADEESDEAAELAKKLANPIAALISVPMQLNYDSNFGPDDNGSMMRLNVQPVFHSL